MSLLSLEGLECDPLACQMNDIRDNLGYFRRRIPTISMLGLTVTLSKNLPQVNALILASNYVNISKVIFITELTGRGVTQIFDPKITRNVPKN